MVDHDGKTKLIKPCLVILCCTAVLLLHVAVYRHFASSDFSWLNGSALLSQLATVNLTLPPDTDALALPTYPDLFFLREEGAITNQWHATPCSELLAASNASYIGHEILQCRKEFVNVISVFGMYCNDLSLFWFTRLLAAQSLLSVSVPKHMIILVHNMANSTVCRGYNSQKQLYHWFRQFIITYFNANLNVHLYFDDEMHSAAHTRNFLARRARELIELQTIDAAEIVTQYHGNIVVQLFDADDIVHPQKMQVIDMVYSDMPINGTVVHSFRKAQCRNFDSPQQEREYETLFDELLNASNESYNFRQMYEFHMNQGQHILDVLKFTHIDIDLIERQYTEEMVLMNMETLSSHHLGSFHGIFNLQREIMNGMRFHDGWPSIVLSSLLANPQKVVRAEDNKFNFDTILSGYDFYLLPYELGIYCMGEFQQKVYFLHDQA